MIVTITNSQLTATINTLGAELISLVKNNKKYIWQVDEMYWNKTSPILFPIVGRLKNDSYTFNGKTYQLPRHGFARNMEFTFDKYIESFEEKFNKESAAGNLLAFNKNLILSFIEAIELFVQSNQQNTSNNPIQSATNTTSN